MKKVFLTNPDADVIDFMVSGKRHTNTEKTVTIDAEGIIVDDATAQFLSDRLGGNITVTEADVKAEAKKAVAKAKAPKAPKAPKGNTEPETEETEPTDGETEETEPTV